MLITAWAPGLISEFKDMKRPNLVHPNFNGCHITMQGFLYILTDKDGTKPPGCCRVLPKHCSSMHFTCVRVYTIKTIKKLQKLEPLTTNRIAVPFTTLCQILVTAEADSKLH